MFNFKKQNEQQVDNSVKITYSLSPDGEFMFAFQTPDESAESMEQLGELMGYIGRPDYFLEALVQIQDRLGESNDHLFDIVMNRVADSQAIESEKQESDDDKPYISPLDMF